MIKAAIKKCIGLIKFPGIWQNYYSIKRLHNASQIKKFKGIHKGATIFCTGTGPSLLKEDVSLLNNQVLIFTNSSYKLIDKINPKRKYWLVQDHNRIKELNEVNRNLFDASFRSIPDLKMLDLNIVSKSDIFIKPEIGFLSKNSALVPYAIESGISFSHALEKNLSMTGNSVIFSAIQLAAYMGARRIVLLGVDMNYGNNANQAYFDKETMGDRFFWAIPYETTAKPAFVEYKRILESNDIQLINCSNGTKEDILDKKTLQEVA